MKMIRKGAIVRKKGMSEEDLETWGEYYEVYKKEKTIVRCVSLKKTWFGVSLVCGVDDVELVNK
jgi:hypothetical protein